jgi:aminopeptidase N
MIPECDDEDVLNVCLSQYRHGSNMTDVAAAFRLICHCNQPAREEVVEDFYRQFHNDPLVVDKWFAIQATSERQDCLANVKKLMNHPAFSI